MVWAAAAPQPPPSRVQLRSADSIRHRLGGDHRGTNRTRSDRSRNRDLSCAAGTVSRLNVEMVSARPAGFKRDQLAVRRPDSVMVIRAECKARQSISRQVVDPDVGYILFQPQRQTP